MAQQLCEVVLGVAELIGGEYRGSSGSLVTGSTTIALSIRRASDGHRLDFSDNTFKSSPTTSTHVLTETPASSGFYVYSLDTTLLAAGQSYLVRIEDTSSGAVLDGLGGELRVRGMNTIVSTGATTAGVASAVAPLATSAEVAALPTASEVTTAVWAAGTRSLTAGAITSTTIADDAITAAKIAANAITSAKIATDAIGAAQLAAGAVSEIQSGLATASALSTAQGDLTAIKGTSFDTATDSLHALRARGDSAWVTATGFAVAGDAMALTTSERASVGTAVWATTTRTLSAGVTLASGAITSTVLDSTALAAITGDVWSESLASYTSGQAGYALSNVAGGSDPATIAAAVWATALPGSFTTGQAGNLLSNVSAGADPATIAAAVVAQSIAGSSAGTVGAALSRVDVATSTLATASALSTAQGDLTAIKGSGFTTGDDLHSAKAAIAAIPTTAAPSAAAVSSQVASDLATAHGAGSWSTASLTGIATAANVTSAVTSINAHTDSATSTLATSAALATAQSAIDAIQGTSFATGTDSLHALRARGDAAWATATGFAVAGDAMTLQNNAITAAKIAADAIGSSQLAASAVSEIQSGLATSSAVSTLQSAVSALPSAADVSSQVAADLELAHGAGSWITATGFAVPGSAMTLSTGAITTTTFASGAITSTVFAQNAADRVWSSSSRSVTGVATGGITSGSFASGALTAAALASDAVAEIVAGVWAEALPGTFTSGQAGYVLANVSGGGGGADAATIAAAVVAQAIAGSSAGTVGGALLNLNATVSSRAAPGDSMALADSAITSAKLAASAITAIQSGLATAAGLTSATSPLATSSALSSLATAVSAIPTTAAPTAAQVSTQVAADLASAHGSGAWTTASTAGLATSSALAQVQADVTAMMGVGFATGDDLHNVRQAVAAIPTTSAPSASAVASAVWALDISANLTPKQAGGALTAIRVFTTWTSGTPTAKVYNTNTGLIDVYGDDGAVRYSVPVHDTEGGSVQPGSGEPWKFGV